MFVVSGVYAGDCSQYCEDIYEEGGIALDGFESMQSNPAVNHKRTSALVIQPGLSYGGMVRFGPRRHYFAIASFGENTPIILVINTGVEMNGYDWFTIETEFGVSGYQWGGLICSQNQLIKGSYKICGF